MATDGNDSNIPETNPSSANHPMDPLGAGAFGVQITTSDVVGGMPGTPTMVPLTSNEGSVMAEHHNLVVLPDTQPPQDFAGLRDKGAQ